MYAAVVKFGKKLEKLTEDRSRAEVARIAKLKPSLVNNYVNRGSEPMATAALKIAKALGVSVEWMIDESQDFPAQKESSVNPANLSDAQLMHEISRRYRHQALRCIQLVEMFERQPWESLAKEIYTYPLGAKLPAEITIAMNLLWQCQTLFVFSRTMYDPKVNADLHHSEMPGADRPKEQLDIERIIERASRILHENPFADLIDEYRLATADFLNDAGRAAAEARYAASMERLKKLSS